MVDDRAAAVGALLRASGQLGALALGLCAAAGAGAGWAAARGRPAAALLLALAALLLGLTGGAVAWRVTRLAGLGFCGIWDHHHAARLVRGQVVALAAAAAIAAAALALT